MSALMQVKFSSYSSFGTARNLSEEKQREIVEMFPTIFHMETTKKDDKEFQQITNKNWENVIIDDTEASKISDLGIVFEVTRFKGTVPYKVDVPVNNELKEFNALHVHLPNHALVGYTKVQVVEDICTDRLQELLDEGWRILCVCPPINQRRPDYILGHPNHDGRIK